MLAGMLTITGHGATLLTQINAASRSDHSGTVGLVFTVGGSNLSVTALGFQDSLDNGLTSSHEVGLWDSTGNLIASVTVPSGTSGTLSGNYRYAAISAVTLIANQQYTIGAQVFNGGDAWTDSGAGAGLSISTDVTAGGDRFMTGGFARPTTDGAGHDLRWGPGNMQYSVVPEPGVALLGGLGALALLRRRSQK